MLGGGDFILRNTFRWIEIPLSLSIVILEYKHVVCYPLPLLVSTFYFFADAIQYYLRSADPEISQRKHFKFISQDFKFNSSTVILSWENYTEGSCSSYVLVKSLNGHHVKSTPTGVSTMVALLRNDMVTRDGKSFSFYIEANNGSNICATSFTEIQIDPQSK